MLRKIVDERYEVVRLLGTGGMGNVYEAVHQGTGRHVALKVIANAELANDATAVSRFQREAKAAGSIDTQHIAQVLDAGTDRSTGLPYIAMEFLIGDDLRDLSAQLGPLDAHLALRIVAQAGAGIQKAHDSGIVHRDIKPANLFLARQSEGRVVVKVLDFGIAKLPSKLLSGADALTATTTGRLLGSPLFMSPEQVRGLKTLDHRTDIWSLGAVLYQTLAGHPPFAESETVGQLMFAICSQRPTPLEQVAPWVRPEQTAIVDRCLRIDPDERYPSAEALVADILALLPGGIDIDEDHLMSASGERVAGFGSRAEVSGGTQSLDDPARFLVEVPSPRLDQPSSKDRTPSSGAYSTMPSASDGVPRANGAPSARRGSRTLFLLALVAVASLVPAIWWMRQPTSSTVSPEPSSAAPERHAAPSKLDTEPVGEAPAFVGVAKTPVEGGTAQPLDATERLGRSTREPRKRVPSAIAPNAGSAVATLPAPVVDSAMPVATARIPAAEPAAAISASSAPRAAESPWKLDREFPVKKVAP